MLKELYNLFVFIGSYDKESVMNYCYDKPELSLYPGYVEVKAQSCLQNSENNYQTQDFNLKKWCGGFRTKSSCEKYTIYEQPLCKWQ
ncbi:hypothetical protein [Spartinivicinus poritis]|uniref:Uncharacterized protein n=1 Tax=Spartinivicinus poritis TaxID=2994640 RepID=A0ABT5U882_9GAMM|nr:hypothetical protein [Spartinivicinus sp. A2-2]MDE1461354.1 hypothetical protein [Spartinivicinus sp. A2-2]